MLEAAVGAARRESQAQPGLLSRRYPLGSVSSRQEEKERRRQERLAREQAERSAASRRKRLQYAFGALLAAAAVAAVVVVIAGAGGDGSGGGGDGPKDPAPGAGVKLPQQQTADLGAAAKAAGCVLENPAVDGSGLHDPKNFKASEYNTNPPTSGRHNPDWYEDGIYGPGDVPRLGMQVHTLEHGRIDVQYKAGTPAADVTKLEALLAEQSGGYHMLLYENTTNMDYEVAATAWGHLLGCKQFNDKVFDAMRTFRTRYIDKGPESVP